MPRQSDELFLGREALFIVPVRMLELTGFYILQNWQRDPA